MNKTQYITAILALFSIFRCAAASPHHYPKHNIYPLLNAGKPQQAYNILLSQEQQWGNNPEYNYLLGLAALQSKQFSQARTAFERSILLDPSNAGAHLDLAITLIELARYKEAQALLDKVRQKFAPPPAIQQLITTLEQRIDHGTRTTVNFYGKLFITAGHSSNVNSGTDKSLIQLELDDSLITLPVSDSSQPGADRYYETGASLNAVLSYQQWQLQLLTALQQRNHMSMSEYDTVNLFAGTVISRNVGRHQLEGVFNASRVWLDHADYQQSHAAQAGYRYHFSNGWQLCGQWKLNRIRYTPTPNNDMDYHELRLSGSYPLSFFNYDSLFTTTVRISHGEAQADRAGGDQRIWQLRSTVALKPGNSSIARLGAFIGQEKDSIPYNTDLFANRIRTTDRWGLNFSYTHKFSPTLSATLDLSHEVTQSTIDLFTTRTNEARLSLNYSF